MIVVPLFQTIRDVLFHAHMGKQGVALEDHADITLKGGYPVYDRAV